MSREGDAVDTLLCVKEVMPDIAASDGDVSPTCTVKINLYYGKKYLKSCRLGAGLKFNVSEKH